MAEIILQALSTFAEYGEEPMKLLQGSGAELVFNETGRRILKEEIMDWGKGCTGIIAGVEPYDAEVLDALPDLKCISRAGVGVDSIDLEYARKKGVVVRNTPDVVVQPVVELALAMIFDLMRKLSLHTRRLQSRDWSKSAGNLLAGKTVGVLGLGAIGRAVSEVLMKLGAKIIGSDVAPDEGWVSHHGIEMLPVDEMLGKADILTIHISVLPDNPFVLGREEIALMKDGAWVINVSRGLLVDDTALAEALLSGKIAGAGLDVFPQEPYSGPLCDLENVVLTPHVATLTKESRLRMETEAVENLLDTLGLG